jgi:hypothetical protein
MEQINRHFNGRLFTIATMHGKEQAIVPILSRAFNMIFSPAGELDTDQLGTFSGERERELSPLESARKKASDAHQQSGIGIVIASEGSFGPHPAMPFVAGDEEILCLKDFDNDNEIVVRVVSAATNYAMKTCMDRRDVREFAQRAKFPTHALIAKQAATSYSNMVKGIYTLSQLDDVAEQFISRGGSVYLETDMRAMNNPSRMLVIAEATEQLVTAMNSLCPLCTTPGYHILTVEPGLPCSLCTSPTRSTLYAQWGCSKCNHTENKYYPSGKTAEDPMYCDYCNP